MSTNSKRVALVIGSGSVKCAAAIGLQNVLRRAGIETGMVVDCSGGSLFAALMALGYDAAEEQMPYLKRLLETKQEPVT